jgi:hypothetical protein
MTSNTARTTSIVWWILVPVFLILTIWAFLSNLGDASFALACLFLILLITAIIVAVVYGGRASRLKSILSGEGLIVHWTYTRDEWQKYAEIEYQNEKAGKKLLFFIVSGCALVVGIIALFISEVGIEVLAVMLFIILMMGFLTWFTTRYNYWQNRHSQGETYIAKNGIYINKQLHLWNHLAARLGSVTYVEEPEHLLVFSFFAPTRTGIEERQARVPVPKGQEEKAREVLTRFQVKTNS